MQACQCQMDAATAAAGANAATVWARLQAFGRHVAGCCVEHVAQCALPLPLLRCCLQCGNGLTTAAAGSVSAEQCLIPAGWGVVSVTPPAAAICANGSYGINSTRAVTSNARCVLCPPNLFTRDTLSGTPAAAPYTSELDCVLKPGWGMSGTGEVKVCPPGTYNAGYNRKPCQ